MISSQSFETQGRSPSNLESTTGLLRIIQGVSKGVTVCENDGTIRTNADDDNDICALCSIRTSGDVVPACKSGITAGASCCTVRYSTVLMSYYRHDLRRYAQPLNLRFRRGDSRTVLYSTPNGKQEPTYAHTVLETGLKRLGRGYEVNRLNGHMSTTRSVKRAPNDVCKKTSLFLR